MKRYKKNDNLESDPIRSAWNNRNQNNMLMATFQKPINQLRNDIMINKIRTVRPQKMIYTNNNNNVMNYHNYDNDTNYDNNNYIRNDDIALEFLPKNDTKKIIPFSNHLNVTNYNNDKYRFKNMSQELMDKDEEIQKYKNEVYQLQIEINNIKKENDQGISFEMENQVLKEKLNDYYDTSRELTKTKHDFKRLEINHNSNMETIELLKKIIHKQHVSLTTKEYEEDTESEYESEESEYSDDGSEKSIKKGNPKKKTMRVPKKENVSEKGDPKKETSKKKEPLVPSKNIYYNSNLKKILLKQGFQNKKINRIMKQLKITPKTNITKELLNDFLTYLKK